MPIYADNQRLRQLGLDWLIDEPAPETEAGRRWRQVLAVEPAAPADPRAEALAQVASEPYDPARYAQQRQALGLDQVGTDNQAHAHLDRRAR